MTTPVALLRAAGLGLVLLAVLAGLPVLILHVGQEVVAWPDTVTWPTWNTAPHAPRPHDQLADWAVATYHELRIVLGLDGAIVLLVLAIAWAGWVGLLACVLLDLAALARHGITTLRSRIDTTPRGLITATVAGTVLLTSTAPVTATPAATPPAVTAPQHPGPTEHTPVDEPTDSADPAEPPVYTTFRGDTLWDVADRYLNDPYRWPDITALNADLDDDVGLLMPGRHLRMPDDAWLIEPRPAPGGSYMVTVQRGETLSDIAARELGDPDRWSELFDLTTHRRQADARTLLDPDLLLPGWQITVPPETPYRPVPEPGDTASPSPESPQLPARNRATAPPAAPVVPDEQGAYRAPLPDPVVLGLVTGAGLLTAGAVALRYRCRTTRAEPGCHDTTPPGPVVRTIRIPENHATETVSEPDQNSVPTEYDEQIVTDAPPSQTVEAETGRTDASAKSEDRADTPLLLDLGTTDESVIGLDLATCGGLGLTAADTGPVLRALLTQAQRRYRDRLAVHTSATPQCGDLVGDNVCSSEEVAGRIAACSEPPLLVVVDTDNAPASLLPWLGNQPTAVVLAVGTWPDGTTLDLDTNHTITASNPAHRGFVGATLFTENATEPTSANAAIETDPCPSPNDDQPTCDETAENLTGIQDTEHPVADNTHEFEQRGIPPAPPEAGPRGRPSAVWRMTVLGSVTVTRRTDDGEHDITDLLTPKLRSLMVYLAIHPTGTTRGSVRDALLPDSNPSRPYNALHAMRSKIRRALGTDGEIDPVVQHGEHLRLDPTVVSVDYWDLQDGDDARRHATTPEQRAVAWRRIAECYTGELAPSMDELWLSAPRQDAHRTALDAITALAQHHRDSDPHRHLALLDHARTLDPTDETLYHTIMRAQAALGYTSTITRTLQLATSALAEIGHSPSPETYALARRLTHPNPSMPSSP